MELKDVVKGMCQLAEVEVKDVPLIRIRKGEGLQDIYVELRTPRKKVRSYYNAAKGVINEVDIREAHERTDSSRLLEVANELAKEETNMDAFRIGLVGNE
jgi:hypothetical protein